MPPYGRGIELRAPKTNRADTRTWNRAQGARGAVRSPWCARRLSQGAPGSWGGGGPLLWRCALCVRAFAFVFVLLDRGICL
jgi:hypothetical protein